MTCLFVLVAFLSIKPGSINSMQGHVVGGTLADITQFPHSVFLEVWCNKNIAWICGASLLNQMMILSAAHCFEGVNKKCRIDAIAGHESIQKSQYLRHVRNFLVHEDYHTKIVRNDIALGHLKKKIPLGPAVQRVMITEYFPVGEKFTIAGWGTINDDTQEVSLILKSVQQYILSPDDCRNVGDIDVGMFCARNSIMHRPSKGDSGSALVMKYGHQVGLVSFRTIAIPEVIVYTNTSYYYKWIGDSARKLHCSHNNETDLEL